MSQMAALQATRGKIPYDNFRVRNHKHKQAAKERRRLTRQIKSDANKNPVEMGETIPPFFIPPRYKLMLKMNEVARNNSRINRKPIPKKKQVAFATEAKDIAQYIQAQKIKLRKETEIMS